MLSSKMRSRILVFGNSLVCSDLLRFFRFAPIRFQNKSEQIMEKFGCGRILYGNLHTTATSKKSRPPSRNFLSNPRTSEKSFDELLQSGGCLENCFISAIDRALPRDLQCVLTAALRTWRPEYVARRKLTLSFSSERLATWASRPKTGKSRSEGPKLIASESGKGGGGKLRGGGHIP